MLVFFVLSGLALGLPVLRSAGFRWRSYYPSRLVRLYVPVLAAVGLAGVLFALAPWGPGPAGSGPVQRATVQQALLDVSLTRGSASFLNDVLWSLHYEVLFSLLLPLYVVVVRAVGRWWPALIAVAVGTSSVARLLGVETVAFLAVFVLGVALADHLADLKALAERVEALAVPGAVWWPLGIGAAVALTASWYPMPEVLRTALGWPLLLLGAVGLVVLATTWPGARRLLESGPVQRLGVLSFSLYLTHLPVVSLLGHAFGAASPWLALLVAVPAALLLAEGFSLLVERPSHRLAQRVGRAAGRIGRRPARRWA